MAFFASIDGLNAARTQWGDNDNPTDPNPPIVVNPPYVPPVVDPPFCSKDGYHREMRVVYGFDRVVCVKDGSGGIPYAYRSLMDASQQARGRRKPRVIPAAVRRDRVRRAGRRRVFKKDKIQKNINENVDNNP